MQGLHDWHDYRCVTVFDYFLLLLIVACSKFHDDVNEDQDRLYDLAICTVLTHAAPDI